jgi:flavin-dependent dehydrogenase
MHYDLIIIGMGLSGLMAAKTAVEAGQKVLLLG